MVKYTTTIKKFGKMGEKTGWTYVEVPADIAEELNPGQKVSYRVKGKLDKFAIQAVALLPMGDGSFIIPLNADIRKGIAKKEGAKLDLQLTVDNNPNPVSSPEFQECLADEPEAKAFFDTLTKGHQNYFMKWIESAKTPETKAKRIAQAVTAMVRKQDYGTMIRSNRVK
jgi:hypothetical protein